MHLADSADVPLATRADLHYSAGLAHFRSLDGEPSRVHFERAAAAYESAGDAVGTCVPLRAHARHRESQRLGLWQPGAHLAELERLVEAIPEAETSLRAYATSNLAEAHAMARDTKAAELLARRAVVLAEYASDEVRCLVQTALGIVLTGALDLEGAAQAYRESLRLGRRTGDAWLRASV